MLKRTIALVLALVAVLAFALAPAAAQDDDGDMAMEEGIVCDSTLITLLFIAEYEYGYESMMDLSLFEKGQFAPWFDTMMSDMSMDDESMDDESMDDESMDDESMDDEPMDDESMGGDMVTLEPGNLADEDPACTELRASVEAFLADAIGSDLSMMDDEG